MLYFMALQMQRIGSQSLGIIIPLILLLLLFPITWWLYKHFAGQQEGESTKKRGRGRPPVKSPSKGGIIKILGNYFWGDLS